MKLVETAGRESALVVGVITARTDRAKTAEYLDELILLADTAGVDVRRRVTQELGRPHPAMFIGRGKAAEIGAIVEEEKLDAVIFDDDLSPIQIRNLEKLIPCKIIDRSSLILQIFASRAKSKEAMTQVELAQLQYLLPRLTRQWTHLSKQYGGVGTKGPGETQIESDRRAIRTRISHLKQKLERISKEREVQRRGRRDQPRAAIVGYTNAGKSTLLNQMSGAGVLTEDRLFATLDTTVRNVELEGGKSILLSDTVGFIRKLPPHLIASFRSTLAETSEADYLLHVIDISNPAFAEQIEVVKATLDELEASGKPTIYVFNKIDRLVDRSIIPAIAEGYAPSVFISAQRGINISALEGSLIELLDRGTAEETIVIKQSDYRTIAKLHELAEIVAKEYEDNSVKVRFRVSLKNMDRVRKLLGRKASWAGPA
jgi:GTP-binding protein HflX